MTKTKHYSQFNVWKEAYSLAIDVYRVTATFPKSELYGIVSQLRRASASVAANIVEGLGRGNEKELKNFLRIARGSATEAHFFTLMSRDLEYLDASTAATLLYRYDGLSIGLHRFIEAIESRLPPNK